MKKGIKLIWNSVVLFFTKWFKTYYIWQFTNDPYSFEIENTSKEEKLAVIFGHNNFVGSENFGNDKSIKIETRHYPSNKLAVKYNWSEDIIYKDVLTKSCNGIVIGKFRICFDQSDYQFYLSNRICLNSIDANGNSEKLPWIPLNSFDLYQFQKDAVDIQRFNNKIIDGNSFFELKIKGKSKIDIVLFCLEKIPVNYFEYKNHKREYKRATSLVFFTPKQGSIFTRIFKKLFGKK